MGVGPGVSVALFPEPMIQARRVGERVELKLPPALLAQIYFEGVLPQAREQPVMLGFGHEPAQAFRLAALHLLVDESGVEWVGLTLEPSQLATKDLPFAAPPRAAAAEWIFGAIELPREVREGDGAYRPMIATFFDPIADFAFAPKLGPWVDVELIASAWREAQAVASAPARVRVASANLAALVRQALPEVDVVVAPTPEIEPLWAGLHDAVDDYLGPEPGYLEGGRIPLALVEDFFAAAAEFRRAKPWLKLAQFVGLHADIPALERRVVVSVVRDEGLGGLGIHLDVDVFEASYAAYDPQLPALPPLDVVAVAFFAKRDLPEPLREELDDFTFAPARGPYPTLLINGPEGHPRAATPADYELATSLLRATAHYAKRMTDGSHRVALGRRHVGVQLVRIEDEPDDISH